MDKIKNFKSKLSASLFLLFCLFISSLFFSGGFYNFAQALTGDYAKTLPATLDLSEWNNLDDDFVAKSGDTMTGILDMGGNRITNLAMPTLDDDAANKSYVDTQIAAITGSGAAGVFVNWGREDCPTGSDYLYSGIGFSASYESVGGSSNLVCLDDSGVSGGAYTETNADMLFPVVTGSSMPSGITSDRVIKCAVCRKIGTCYENYGGGGCNTASGFSEMYAGYVLGGNSNSASYKNSLERACVNSNFDAGVTPSFSGGAFLFGTRIDNSFGLGYSVDTFLRCSLCCN